MKNRQTSTSSTKGQGMSVWRMEAEQTNAFVVGERGQNTRNSSSYRKCFSNREAKHGWMASLGGHVEWVGESDAGNTVTFLMVIRFQNHESDVLFSYIYLFAKHAAWPLCISGVKSVIIFGFHVKSLLLIR